MAMNTGSARWAKRVVSGTALLSLFLGVALIVPAIVPAQQDATLGQGGLGLEGIGPMRPQISSPFDIQTQAQSLFPGLFPNLFQTPTPQTGQTGFVALPCQSDPRLAGQEALSRIEAGIFLTMFFEFAKPGAFFNAYFSRPEAPEAPQAAAAPSQASPRPGGEVSQRIPGQPVPGTGAGPSVPGTGVSPLQQSLATILTTVQAPSQYEAQFNALRAAVLSQPGVSQPRTGQQLSRSAQQAQTQAFAVETGALRPAFVPLPFEPLRQFGYALFECPSLTFAPVEDVPVGPDYVIGPGDNLIINVWGGPMDSSIPQVVSRNGEIRLPKIGPVRLWGLTFAQAERMLREQLSRYYRGFQTNLTLGKLRTIKVYMVGDVIRPGNYTVSGLSTLTNALTAGSGPAKLGSLRNIQLRRNNRAVGTIDLYDFLLRGERVHDFRLESGDTIFVPPVGPVAGVAGEVIRPAIYELKGPTTITDLIEMAGGFSPGAYLKRAQILRTSLGKERTVVDVDLTNGASSAAVQNGDVVRILPVNPKMYNVVLVEGAVKQPGTYQLKPGMRLGQLLTREELLPEAHFERVEIQRQTQDGKGPQVIELDLAKAWTGDAIQDVVLAPQDRITVRTEVRPPASVTLTGEVKRPGVYGIALGERLSSVLKRAGGYTSKAFPRGAVFARRSAVRAEKEQLEKFIQGQERRLLAEAGTVVVSGVDREDVGARSQTIATRRELLDVLASRVVLGRVVVRVDDVERLEGSPDDLVLEDGDALHIPSPPASVTVVGSVRNPTSVLYREDADVDYYLNRAGGLSKEADRKELYIQRSDGSAVTGFSKIRPVEAGDTVVVPPKAETQYRPISIGRDLITVLSQTLLSVASLAAIFAVIP